MISVFNPIYSAVYKRLIADDAVSTALLDTLFHTKFCVKKLDGDKHYVSANNDFVYYSRFDAVFLEGPNKLDKIFLELYRVVNHDFKVSFMFEFIGQSGHYRGIVDGKDKEHSTSHLDKVVALFGGAFCNTWNLKVQIDELYDDSPEYKTIIDALQRISSDTDLSDEMLSEHFDDLIAEKDKQIAEN